MRGKAGDPGSLVSVSICHSHPLAASWESLSTGKQCTSEQVTGVSPQLPLLTKPRDVLTSCRRCLVCSFPRWWPRTQKQPNWDNPKWKYCRQGSALWQSHLQGCYLPHLPHVVDAEVLLEEEDMARKGNKEFNLVSLLLQAAHTSHEYYQKGWDASMQQCLQAAAVTESFARQQSPSVLIPWCHWTAEEAELRSCPREQVHWVRFTVAGSFCKYVPQPLVLCTPGDNIVFLGEEHDIITRQ